MFYPMAPNDVSYRSNPQKAFSCAETRRLSHKAWKSVQRFDLCACPRKKDRTVKKVTKALYFTYLGRSTHWTDPHQDFHSRYCLRCNHVCKALSWNFQGLRFNRGSYFQFSYSCMGLTTELWYRDLHWIKFMPILQSLCCYVFQRLNVSCSFRVYILLILKHLIAKRLHVEVSYGRT